MLPSWQAYSETGFGERFNGIMAEALSGVAEELFSGQGDAAFGDTLFCAALHYKPIPVLIGELNRHLKGWMNYFSFGYPSSAYCEIERYVRDRLIQHLQRRSQRPYRPPKGELWLQHLTRLGLVRLSGTAHA